MTVKKLIVVEISVEEELTVKYPKGYAYPCFQDPETGKYYDPMPGFTVIGEDLEDRFTEVKQVEENTEGA